MSSKLAVWPATKDAVPLGPTHGGLAMDRGGRIYCSTDGPRSVVVFDSDESVVHQFAPDLAGIHALTITEEAGAEVLLCAHLSAHRVVMLTLDGAVIWTLGVPMESGLYQSPEEFKPTAALRCADGTLFVADGYGASVVHQYDRDRRYVKSFGGREAGAGQLRNCHGLALDTRGPEPRLLICDRRNRRLVHYDLEGRFVGVLAEDLRRPCSVAFAEGVMAVAELEGRVTILDGQNRIVASVGDNPDRSQWAQYEASPETWQEEVFIAPHAVCFDGKGNLVVSEWNARGRLSKVALGLGVIPEPSLCK